MKIVVLGGGYAGLYAARRASWAKSAEIVIVDPDEAWVEKTRFHQVAVGDQSVQCWSRERLFPSNRVEVVRGNAVAVDLESKRIEVASSDGGRQTFAADILVYAIGSRGSGARGLHGLDSFESSERLGMALRALGDSSTVSVVGGGLTGIELAAEVAETFPELNVQLVSNGPIGRGLSQSAQQAIGAGLHELGVAVYSGRKVRTADEHKLELEDGEVLTHDLAVWTAGTQAHRLASEAGLRTDDTGRVLVNRAMQSISHPWVFAVGDCAALDAADQESIRPSAFVGIVMGAVCGDNISRLSRGREVKALRFGYLVQAVSLGRKNGVVQFTNAHDRPRPWVVTGRPAAVFKNALERYLVVGALQLERIGTKFFVAPPGNAFAGPRARQDLSSN